MKKIKLEDLFSKDEMIIVNRYLNRGYDITKLTEGFSAEQIGHILQYEKQECGVSYCESAVGLSLLEKMKSIPAMKPYHPFLEFLTFILEHPLYYAAICEADYQLSESEDERAERTTLFDAIKCGRKIYDEADSYNNNGQEMQDMTTEYLKERYI